MLITWFLLSPLVALGKEQVRLVNSNLHLLPIEDKIEKVTVSNSVECAKNVFVFNISPGDGPGAFVHDIPSIIPFNKVGVIGDLTIREFNGSLIGKFLRIGWHEQIKVSYFFDRWKNFEIVPTPVFPSISFANILPSGLYAPPMPHREAIDTNVHLSDALIFVDSGVALHNAKLAMHNARLLQINQDLGSADKHECGSEPNSNPVTYPYSRAQWAPIAAGWFLVLFPLAVWLRFHLEGTESLAIEIVVVCLLVISIAGPFLILLFGNISALSFPSRITVFPHGLGFSV